MWHLPLFFLPVTGTGFTATVTDIADGNRGDVRNAQVQTARVAKARSLGEDKVRELIQQSTDTADLGVLGEPGVNVLPLNLALDALGQQ